ncbi:MAG TPA: hypothetical protein VLV31_13530 [Candidatus Acidoferrales bacterium]|nr:hypothetical protein [Candidatus Acidoferrales bacterium]
MQSEILSPADAQPSNSTTRTLQDLYVITKACEQNADQLRMANGQIQSIAHNLTTINNKFQELIIYLRIQRSQASIISPKTTETSLSKHPRSSNERTSETVFLRQTNNSMMLRE